MGSYKNDKDINRRKFLEDQIDEKYLKIDKLINQRKAELIADLVSKNITTSYTDDIGASKTKSFTNSTENMNLTFSSDKVILELEKYRQAFIDLIELLNDEDKKIFYLRWGENTRYDWSEIYYILKNSDTGYNYSHTKQLYRRRDFILDRLAEILNII